MRNPIQLIDQFLNSIYLRPVMSFGHFVLVIINVILFHDSLQTDDLRYLAVASDFLHHPFAQFDPFQNCITAPGYPLFLALTHCITGFNYMAIGCVQAIFFLIALETLTSNLEKIRFISFRQRNLAFSIAALAPNLLYINSVVMTESICGSLFMLSIAGLINAKQSTTGNIITALAYTLLVLTKFEYLVLLPIICFMLLFQRRSRLTIGICFTILTAFIANGYKNQQIYGKFKVTSFGGAQVLYGGNNLLGDGTWHKVRKSTSYLPEKFRDEYYIIDSLPPVERCLGRSELFTKMAMNAWDENPLMVLKTMPLKFLKLWIIPSNMDYHTGQTEFRYGLQLHEPFDRATYPMYAIAKHFLYLALHWIMLVLIIVGAIMRWLSRGLRQYDILLIILFFAISIVYAGLFYGLGRFSMPMYTLLTIYMAFFADRILDLLRNRALH